MGQMLLVQESEKAFINGLQSEKAHLELTLKENLALKEQYKMKHGQVQQMYENLFKEAQTFKRQIVGVDEIKKDRDERVSALRMEVNQIQAQLDKLTSEHAALKVHSKSVNEEYMRLNDDYKTMQRNLNMSNDVRQQAEDHLIEIQKQYRSIKEAY